MIVTLKPKNLDQQRMAIFAFTLLLNSKTLKIITEYFELMCKLFLSKYSTMRVKIAFESMIKILQERPEELLEIKKIMNKTEKSLKLQSELTNNSEVFTALQISDLADNDEIPEIEENQEVEEAEKEEVEKENNEQKRTIKESSPFTQIFYEIYNRCLTDISSENESSRQPTNKYYFRSYIEKILDEHLPYCFLWGSFAFQGLDFSRITNGNVENYNRFRKDKPELNKPPHRYIDSNYEMVSGCCIEFKEKVANQTKSAPIKRKTNNKANINSSSSIYGPVEINQFQAKEVFKKPRNRPPSKNCGYQNAVVLASLPVRDVDCSLSFGNAFSLF
jgi:hypothetical protein